MSEFILAVCVFLFIIFVVDYQANESYYKACSEQQHHSYARCFYDHVLKLD